MVWDLACHASTGFSAFLPLSGGFWEPFPTECETGPVNLRHTHGRADTTFPFGGRAVAGMRQGDVAKGLALWRDIDGCAAAPSAHGLDAGLACDVWSQCRSGRQLQLCRHDGGHMIEAWHLESGLIWARGLPGP